MLLRWLNPKKVFVPVTGSGIPLADRLERGQVADFESISAMSHNSLHVDVLLHVLRQVRDAADRAVTPDELKGLNKAISIVKSALLIPSEAEAVLREMRANKDSER